MLSVVRVVKKRLGPPPPARETRTTTRARGAVSMPRRREQAFTRSPASERSLEIAAEAVLIGARAGAHRKRGRPFTSRAAEPVIRPQTIDLPAAIPALADRFSARGRVLYLVGGAVRDALWGRAPKDYDLATDATPGEVEAILLESGLGCRIKSQQLGVRVAVDGEHAFEIATFRRESSASDGRRPRRIAPGTLEDDARRRDLTINALYYDPLRQEVVDHVGGLEDAGTGRVRTIGDPKRRFREDGLRVLRFLRFFARFSATDAIDPETARAIAAHRRMPGVSRAGIRAELEAALAQVESVERYLALAQGHGLLPRLFPGARPSPRLPESRELVVVLAALLRGLEPPRLARALEQFGATRAETRSVGFLLQLASLDPSRVLQLKKQQQRAGVGAQTVREFAAAVGLPAKPVHVFLEFSPSIRPDDPRLEKLTGRERGAALERLESERFSALLG